jgi:hypothetical protein
VHYALPPGLEMSYPQVRTPDGVTIVSSVKMLR